MEDKMLEEIKGLFQEAYSVIYSDGAFDAMADQAEADGDLVPAVAQLTATIVNTTIKDAGVTDMNVLFGLAILLIADMLEALEQIGIMSKEGDMEAIINQGMQQVLGENPQLAEAIAQNPQLQEAMAQSGGAEGLQGAVEEQADQGGVVAEGAVKGAENARGVI